MEQVSSYQHNTMSNVHLDKVQLGALLSQTLLCSLLVASSWHLMKHNGEFVILKLPFRV